MTRRFAGFAPAPAEGTPTPQHSGRLMERQKQWITDADTFFISTRHPESGADLSHRGGNPGFVRILDDRTLVFPDYSGNNLFNTLGNLKIDQRAGLLFLDFESGHVLQLSGTAEILWEEEVQGLHDFPGTNRLVRYRIDETVQINEALRSRYLFDAYSPYNPGGTGWEGTTG
jgi:uncharacterized protein